jgi:hypothetical protein
MAKSGESPDSTMGEFTANQATGDSERTTEFFIWNSGNQEADGTGWFPDFLNSR